MTAEFHWDDARIFLAIARAGTLSGAADKMNMGIATVSRRLDRLEQALNVPLFSRHQSGYRLTDDGEALLARAEALEYAGPAFGEAAQLQGHVAGLSVWPPRITRHAFYSALPERALDHYPELRVEVLSGVQPVNLHRRDADLAIRMVKPEAGHLTLKRLGTVGFGVYGAADCLVGADGLSLSEADFVGWPETHQHLPAAQWITRTLRGRPCKVEANTLVAQVSAVSAGLGLGVLPHFMARASGLQCLQPEIGADQTLWLVMHSDLAGSRRVRVLADHLIALFADHQDRLAMP
ncbi:LysR family transcriptional regulator [Klebsiella pneumoniae]|nr:LysR family transcriptional regulator [Klebsiella pneumoniae]